MSISNYFKEIKVLENSGTSNQIGGKSNDFVEIAIIKGVINQSYSNQDNSKGRENESSEYKGFFEYSEQNSLYLNPKNRLKDGENIYKIKGIPKNTINRNHHLRVDLQLESYLKNV